MQMIFHILVNQKMKLKNYKKGDEIEVKVLEIKPKDQRIKFGVKQLEVRSI